MAMKDFWANAFMADPVMSGKFGGANQYPTLIEGAQLVMVPDLAIEVPYRALKLLNKEVFFTKTWREISAMKGATLGEKALKWKVYKNNKDFLLKAIDASYVRVSVATTSYQVGKLITQEALGNGNTLDKQEGQ